MKINIDIKKLTKKKINNLLLIYDKKLCFNPIKDNSKFNKIIIKTTNKIYKLKNAEIWRNHHIIEAKQEDILYISEKNKHYNLLINTINNIKIKEEYIEFELNKNNKIIKRVDGESWVLNHDEKEMLNIFFIDD
jgi:hypothetical protein